MEILDFNPIAFELFGIPVYWYGVLFALSIIIAWAILNTIINKTSENMTPSQLDKFMFGAIITTVVSARMGHVIFFEPGYYFHNPIEIIMLRNGGMSFHGGLIGMSIYTWIYCRRHKINKMFLLDSLSFAVSASLITGRLANFINQELVGKIWASEYGVIFRNIDDFPRYPTQLYEALTEGLLAFMIMAVTLRIKGWSSMGSGLYTSIFFITYSGMRYIIEFFKDVECIKIFNLSLTTGQILCIIMFVLWAIIFNLRKSCLKTR